MTDYQVKRTYRGQVLVMPPGAPPLEGEWTTSKDRKRYFRTASKEAMAYGRTSSSGEHLKGGGDGLAKWKAAMAAIGTVMSDTAQSEIATLINEYDGDPYYRGDDGGSESGKSRLLRAVEKAADMAGESSRAALGSEFHKLGELVNQGKTPHVVRPRLIDPLKHYQARVKPIKFHAQEFLVVNDEIQRAGSPDYLLEIPAGTDHPEGPLDQSMICVGDLKTGKWDFDYPAGVTAQLAGYGLGWRYNQDANERLPLHPDASREWGVLIHFPLTTTDARVQFYWIDLALGLRAAQLNNALDKMIKYFRSVEGKPVKFEMEYK